MKNKIFMRIHHLMCVHGFSGKGYSPKFVQNFWNVIDRLNEEDATIRLVSTTQDDICKPCPNNVDGETCNEEKKIQALDKSYAQTLKVNVGDELTFESVRQLVSKEVSLTDFEKNCEPCQWKALGVCREALIKLKAAALVMLALTCAVSFAQDPQPEPAPSDAAELKELLKPLEKASTETTAEPIRDILTVELLEQKILFDKSKRVPAFYKSLNALNKGDFSGALALIKPIEKNEEFLDYYHFISGRAEMGRLKKTFAKKDYSSSALAGERAIQHFISALGTNAYSSLSKRLSAALGEAEVYLAECYYKNKKIVKAISLFESGFQRLSQVNLMALIPKQGIVSYAIRCEKKPNDICISWTTKLIPFMVKTEEAKLLEKIAAFKKPVFEKTTSIPYKVDLDLQAFQKAFAAYLEGKYADSFSQLNSLLKEYPRTTIKLRSKFWMARSAQKAGKQLIAETIYKEVIQESPFTYYALMSSWFSGIELSRMLDLELPIVSTEIQGLNPSDIVHIKKAEKFIASAANELALIELQDVRPSSNMSNEFLVYLSVLNHLAGNHLAVFQIFGELSGRNYQGLFSSYGEKVFFPTLSLPLSTLTVRNFAKDYKTDSLLTLSIMKQESAFNPEAVSVANAYGLMQIIPPTARDLDPKIDVLELLNPHTNVKLGTKYIAQLLGRYKGNVIAALAAYNAGPGNSDRWYKEFGKFANEEYIEQIGYRETREYVQNILRNYYWYNRRINGESFKDLQSLLARF